MRELLRNGGLWDRGRAALALALMGQCGADDVGAVRQLLLLRNGSPWVRGRLALALALMGQSGAEEVGEVRELLRDGNPWDQGHTAP